MPLINVTTPEGVESTVEGKSGISVMDVIQGAGFDMLALCGGCCSCATCHVYVDPAFADLLPPITEDESDLLDNSAHRRPESRLSCQIPFDEKLAGLKVTIVTE